MGKGGEGLAELGISQPVVNERRICASANRAS